MLMAHAVSLQDHRVRWVVEQVAIVLLGVFFYFQVRGLTAASRSIAVDHAHDVLAFEERLGVDIEKTVQDPVTDSDALSTLVNWIYIWGHWPVIAVTMAWLVWRYRDIFLRLRNAMLVSGGIGLIVFVSYPLAPPRLVDPDLVDTVTERSYAYRVLQPPNFVNPYAAMPSLHAGWDLLVGISIATAAGSLLVRVIGCVLPVLMAFSVVATANHYVVDVVAGLVLAMIGYAAAVALEGRRSRRAGPAP